MLKMVVKIKMVIELRRGVEDLDLGNSQYAQVRISVDGTHFERYGYIQIIYRMVLMLSIILINPKALQ